ncbi:MAG: SGNH/GDSL hydrolase family protein, partial [Rubripirellula sp.]
MNGLPLWTNHLFLSLAFWIVATSIAPALADPPVPPAKSTKVNDLASTQELYLDRKLAFANPKADNPELPNVLLIGDSISIGYTAYVRRELQGKADVYRIPTNGRNSAYGVEKLDQWLSAQPGHWDVIHFNWGLWDLCYRHPQSKTQGNRDKINGTLTESLDGYTANLKTIVNRLIESFKQSNSFKVFITTM